MQQNLGYVNCVIEIALSWEYSRRHDHILIAMIQLPGYSIAQQIYTSARTLVYRGVRETDRMPVVLKLMQNQYPSFSELVQFRNQYTIAKNIDIPGILKPYSLETYGNGYALILPDFGGISLKEWREKQEGDRFLGDFLCIAIQLATILDGLHRDRVIHKDIKPTNILINPDTKEVKLIDFNIASLLSRETQVLQNPHVLEGTLAYISPEQTGRMNRGIDYRTDFYSLGITFFELLTGELPFTSSDPMELIHCHIAKIPPSVWEINPKIPRVLSLIIGKLMAKNAENRYQSALGLKHDLEICWQEWQSTNGIGSFNIGQRDLCDRFIIPEKLYGRDTEVQTLLAAFDRIAGKEDVERKTEMVLVGGFSGIGKTAVVNEVHKPIVRQRGYFIKGKFDQFQRNVPFSAFVQSFRELMGQLLAESDAQLAQWKAKILDAVGENGQVIIEVIPELESIIGKQPPVPELSGIAAQNRFNLLFEKFICVFTSIEHPLAIFIDDLQWADSASLKLMQLLMSESEAEYLLLIGAYRDNEVSPAHPFILTVDEVQKAGATVNTITLQALTEADIDRLVVDTLSCDRTLAQPLTKLVYQKTKGNPFFATQLLKSLHEDGSISFNFDAGYWQCDLTKVKASAIADDVVEFMVSQLQKLPGSTQEVLKLAACIGNQFDLHTLAIVFQKSPEETASSLWKALREGFILPTAEIYKFYQEERELSERLPINNYEIPHYKFLHDRIQQAAYSLIAEQNKQATHLKIGKLLLLNNSEEEREEKIFEIVNQLNIGVGLIGDRIEKDRLIQLNLSAANKAKSATAYAAAVSYCLVGINLLDPSSWENKYDLTLALYATAAEVSSLNGDFQQMEQFAEIVLQQAKTLLDKVKVYETQIVARIVQRKQPEAIKIALSILKLMGISLPESPAESDFNLGLAEVYTNLADRNIPELLELPAMVDANYQAGMRILSSIISAAYVSAPALLPLIVFKMVNLSLKFGNSPHSIMGYCMQGVILCAGLGKMEEGYKFGNLGLMLLEKINGQEFGAKVGDLFFGLTNHWQEHLGTSLPNLRQAYCTGLEIGDLEFAGYCISKYCFYSFWLGKELGYLEQEISKYSKALGQFKQLVPQNYVNSYWQGVLNLLGRSESPCDFSGTAYNDRVMLPQYLQDNDFTGIAYSSICQTAILYMFGEYVKAQETVELAEKNIGGVSGTVCIPVFYFYDSLIRLEALKNVQDSEVNETLEKVKANQEKIEIWAERAPTNYWHKFYLVEAEQNRTQGKYLEAIELYDRAIVLAKENEYLNEEALANELAAKFYLEWGKEKIAQTYMTEAYYAYARWGAKAKVLDLEKRYPHLLTPLLNQKLQFDSTLSSLTVGTVITTNMGKSSIFDLDAVMKAAQAISGEIELEKLLSSLMQVVIENAGAQKGLLILKQNNSWLIEVQAQRINQTETTMAIAFMQGIPIESSQEIPHSLIYYVLRTQETLVFDDATVNHQFAGDRYIIANQPKSVLCVPICDRGQCIGILYLENNITTGAFSGDRVQILKILAAQAAISLENARLYQQVADYSQNLETEVNRKTQALQLEIQERQQAELLLRQKTQHLETTLQKLKQTQAQLIQTEKMSSLGQLVAGVAHEINNPVNFIHGNLSHVSEYTSELLELVQLYQEIYPNSSPEIQQKIAASDLEFISQDLPKVLQSMETGTERIREIVRSLRNFSRLDESEIKHADIHQGLDSTLTILQNRLRNTTERPEIQVIKEYAQLPIIKCYPGALNQVFMNILNNAIDALEEAHQVRQDIASIPSIRIRTELNKERQIIIKIADRGAGMSEDVKQRLFDPFFTTKPVGKGTGLGLSISYQIIVEKHGGTIEVNSTLGQGTEFAIALPIQ